MAQRIVTLLRHARVMPFVPMDHEQQMVALLQPVDRISRTTLQSIQSAHAVRGVINTANASMQHAVGTEVVASAAAHTHQVSFSSQHASG